MKAHHTLVVGDSGAGKTTLLREIHAEFSGYSVWIDHTGASGIDGRQGGRYATVDSPSKLRACEATRIRYLCSDPLQALEAIRDHLTAIYDRTGYGVQVIVDEAQTALPDSADSGAGSGNVLAQMLHEDRDKGVKVVLGTQDPQDLYYPPIKQCRHITWVGPPNSLHKGFLQYYNLDGADLPTREYQYHVIRPTLPPKVVFRGETRKRFA